MIPPQLSLTCISCNISHLISGKKSYIYQHIKGQHCPVCITYLHSENFKIFSLCSSSYFSNKQSTSSLDWIEEGENHINFLEIISKWTAFIHLHALNPFSQKRKMDEYSNTWLIIVQWTGFENQIFILHKNLSTILYTALCM